MHFQRRIGMHLVHRTGSSIPLDGSQDSTSGLLERETNKCQIPDDCKNTRK